MARNIAITLRLNDKEYGQLMDLVEKFNNNPKRNKAITIPELLRIFILWEHEALCEKQHKANDTI